MTVTDPTDVHACALPSLAAWGLSISFAVLNPLFLLAHGYLWTAREGYSSGLLVYAMKLTPLIYLLTAVVALGIANTFAALRTKIVLPMALVFGGSLVTPIVFETSPSLFYYIADAAGLAVTYACFLLTKKLLQSRLITSIFVFQVMVAGAAVTSVIIFSLHVWSSGGKVSIPPDIHYGISVALAVFLSSNGNMLGFAKWAPLVIAAAIGPSQFRMNMLVSGASVLAGWFWIVVHERMSVSVKRGLLRSVILALILVPFSSFVHSAWVRSPDQNPAGGVDQRFVEAALVRDEMMRQPWSFVLGKGFGATFENTDGVLEGHPNREHSIHNSIFALLLRNGAPGVLLFLVPALLAGVSCFNRDWTLFVSAVGLLAIYLACMTDQYVYWGGYFGIALAVWYHSWQANVVCLARISQAD